LGGFLLTPTPAYQQAGTPFPLSGYVAIWEKTDILEGERRSGEKDLER